MQQKLIRQAGDLKLRWREVVEYTCTANKKYRSEEGRAVKLLEEAHRDVPCRANVDLIFALLDSSTLSIFIFIMHVISWLTLILPLILEY